MLLKKIIPCLDINNGRVVKGVKFIDLVDAGDPAEIAAAYCKMGADEIVFLDISATVEGRSTMTDVIARAAKGVTIPLTVGGGISKIGHVDKLMSIGASKVSINTAAVENPEFITEISKKYGSDKVVVAIDVGIRDGKYSVLTRGGNCNTGMDAVEWAKKVESLGAGEILLTSMDADGTKDGYDIKITKAIAEAVKIPVTASGGAGKKEDFLAAFKAGCAGALAASLFHFNEIEIAPLKAYLAANGVNVKI